MLPKDKNPSFKLVIFDMDKTLYTFIEGNDSKFADSNFYRNGIKPRITEFIAKKLTLSNAKALSIRDSIYNKYETNVSIGLEKEYNISRKEFFSYVWDIDPAKYLNSDANLRPFLLNLTVKKAILTTAPSVWVRNVLEYFKISDLFEGIFDGVGDIRKPQKQAYTQVLDSLKIEPNKSIFIDDNVEYLKPAKKLGIYTALVGTTSNEKPPFVDFTLKDVYQIGEILG